MDFLLMLFETLKESLFIISIIFFLMIFIEIFVLKYKDKIIELASKNKFMSYVVSSFFGSIPGCIGTFAMDSMYMAGLLGFGGIVAVMISTFGDEAFLMISMVATGNLALQPVLILIVVLFLLGILGGFLADYFHNKGNFKLSEKCCIKVHNHKETKINHFFKEHIWNHIIKEHIWKIFLWLFAAIFVIDLVKPLIDASKLFAGTNLIYLLLIASLVAVLPISGPNIFLLVMFSQGLIPFSILLANSIIQDGHGLLPIIGHSLNDAFKIKLFNFLFGLSIGFILLIFGL